jgi:hypothetical protein
MSTQYRLVQSGKTASGGCSAGQGSSEPVAPRILEMITHLGNVSSSRNKIKKYRKPSTEIPDKETVKFFQPHIIVIVVITPLHFFHFPHCPSLLLLPLIFILLQWVHMK